MEGSGRIDRARGVRICLSIYIEVNVDGCVGVWWRRHSTRKMTRCRCCGRRNNWYERRRLPLMHIGVVVKNCLSGYMMVHGTVHFGLHFYRFLNDTATNRRMKIGRHLSQDVVQICTRCSVIITVVGKVAVKFLLSL